MAAITFQDFFAFEGKRFQYREKLQEPGIVSTFAKYLSLNDLSALSQVNRHFRKAVQKLSVEQIKELIGHPLGHPCIEKFPESWWTRFAAKHPSDSPLGIVYRIYANFWVFDRNMSNPVTISIVEKAPVAQRKILSITLMRKEKKEPRVFHASSSTEPLRQAPALPKQKNDIPGCKGEFIVQNRQDPKDRFPQKIQTVLNQRVQLDVFEKLYSISRTIRFNKYAREVTYKNWAMKNPRVEAEEKSFTRSALKNLPASVLLSCAVYANYWEDVPYLVRKGGMLEESYVFDSEETNQEWIVVYRTEKIRCLKEQVDRVGESSSSSSVANSPSPIIRSNS